MRGPSPCLSLSKEGGGKADGSLVLNPSRRQEGPSEQRRITVKVSDGHNNESGCDADSQSQHSTAVTSFADDIVTCFSRCHGPMVVLALSLQVPRAVRCGARKRLPGLCWKTLGWHVFPLRSLLAKGGWRVGGLGGEVGDGGVGRQSIKFRRRNASVFGFLCLFSFCFCPLSGNVRQRVRMPCCLLAALRSSPLLAVAASHTASASTPSPPPLTPSPSLSLPLSFSLTPSPWNRRRLIQWNSASLSHRFLFLFPKCASILRLLCISH